MTLMHDSTLIRGMTLMRAVTLQCTDVRRRTGPRSAAH